MANSGAFSVCPTGGGCGPAPVGIVTPPSSPKTKKPEKSKKTVDSPDMICYNTNERMKGGITMTASEAIKGIAKSSGITQREIAELCGLKGQTNVSEALRHDMRVSMLVRLAGALNCEVRIVDKNSGNEIAVDMEKVS